MFEGVDWIEEPAEPPQLTFGAGASRWQADREVQVLPAPTVAHTRGDTVVWLPGERVLFAGDLVMNGTTPHDEFATLSDPERLVANIHRAYAEIEGHPRGTGVDVGTAMADMVRFHGGRLRAYA